MNRRQRGWRRPLTMLPLLVVICVVALVAVACGAESAHHAHRAPAKAGEARSVSKTVANGKVGVCPDPSQSGALHVSGNKVLDSQNAQFTFYGVTIYGGLEDAGGNGETWQQGQAGSMAQIEAAKYWHANTVRIQVGEGNVFNDANPRDGVDESFLAALCTQVRQARKQGMEAVINDQTEWPDWDEYNPTARTESFWKVMAAMFGNEPGVIFDLYNEPRLYYPKSPTSYRVKPKINPDWVWNTWRNGGNADGQHFIGMQQLVNYVRSLKAENQIWVEGAYVDDSLGLMGKYMVKGTNLVLSLHHPQMTGPKNWDKYFGYLTKTYPMVDGEWGQYAASRPECRASAYKMVPEYLSYLRAHGVGVLGWALEPGAMLADPGHTIPNNLSYAGEATNPKALTTPSTMSSSYKCDNNHLGQGAGRLLLEQFERYSKLPS